jgi:hypothetical protein
MQKDLKKETPESYRLAWEQRLQICETWIAHAKAVADKSGLSSAKAVFDFIASSFEPGVPTEDGLFARIESHHQPNKYFFLVPLTREDLRVSVRCFEGEPTYAAKTLACYCIKTEDTGGRIYINTFWPATNLWQGILLLHEGAHALRDFTRSESQSPTQEAQEEIDVLNMEAAIVTQIAGQHFVDAVASEVERIHSSIKVSEDQNEFTFPSVKYPNVFDELFGISLSNEEKVLRTSLFSHEVFRVLFDKLFGEQGSSELLKYSLQRGKRMFL